MSSLAAQLARIFCLQAAEGRLRLRFAPLRGYLHGVAAFGRGSGPRDRRRRCHRRGAHRAPYRRIRAERKRSIVGRRSRGVLDWRSRSRFRHLAWWWRRFGNGRGSHGDRRCRLLNRSRRSHACRRRRRRSRSWSRWRRCGDRLPVGYFRRTGVDRDGVDFLRLGCNDPAAESRRGIALRLRLPAARRPVGC